MITLPLLSPAIAIVLLNVAVLAIGLFDQIHVLVGLAGLPREASR